MEGDNYAAATLEHAGNHTIAVVKGCEDYETISKALRDHIKGFAIPFGEINRLFDAGCKDVSENSYEIELFFGGGMKVHEG